MGPDRRWSQSLDRTESCAAGQKNCGLGLLLPFLPLPYCPLPLPLAAARRAPDTVGFANSSAGVTVTVLNPDSRTVKAERRHTSQANRAPNAVEVDNMAAVTLKGNPVEIIGNELKAGDTAPDFQLQNTSLEEITLASSAGKVRIVATIPSLDTPVCHAETKKFNDEVQGLDGVEVLVVSMDLPFGQKRWCGSEGVENVTTLSAHRCTKFGEDYGVLIKGGPLDRCLCRAIFVVDGDGKITHVEYVSEIAEQPDFGAVLAAAK